MADSHEAGDVEQALRGNPDDAVFDAVVSEERELRTVSAGDVERRGGLSADDCLELVRAWGFPAPGRDEPWFTEEEAGTLVELARVGDYWPADVRRQTARVWGNAFAGAARTEVQLFRMNAGRMQTGEVGTEHALRALQTAATQLLPLAGPLLIGVHRRWVERELAQAAVHEIEMRTDGGAMQNAVEVTIAFCDLAGFAAFVEEQGDAAAVDAIERFGALLGGVTEAHHVVKTLGDGYMLVYEDETEAVDAMERLVRLASHAELPPVHVGMHSGVAIFRNGDYFGGAVNLAARLGDAADAGEVLASVAVADATTARFEWQPHGRRRVRGFTEPVDVARLVARR